MKFQNKIIFGGIIIIILVIISSIIFSITISDQVKQIAIERAEKTNSLYLSSLANNVLALDDFQPQNFTEKKIVFTNYFMNLKNEETVRLKVWAKDGTIIYSDDDELFGKNFKDNPRFQTSINGDVTSEIKDPIDPENISELGYGQLMEIYIPITLDTIEPIGVIELYFSLDSINNSVAEINSTIFTVTIFLIGLISTAIFLFSIGVVKISQQNIKQEKLALLGQVSARISHDLKNPLSLIQVLVEQNTLNISQDPKQITRNEKMKRAILRMTNQIDNIMNFLKDRELVMKKVSLYSVFDAAVEYTTFIPTVSIQKEGNDGMIVCDPTQIEIVFANILSNAVQAMHNVGEITLRIFENTDHVEIVIENTGPEIPDKILSTIFESLFTTKTNGTGLGLISCKSIINQHGGIIQAYNNPTRFVITIPKSFPKKDSSL